MRLLLLATCLFACSKHSIPEVSNDAEIAALVSAVLADYGPEVCVDPTSLRVPPTSRAQFVQSGLADTTALKLVDGIENQSVHKWKAILDQRIGTNKECLSISFPLLYDQGESAYIFIADQYGQGDYIYTRDGSSWRLKQVVSKSIH